uniref:class I tRNA ligase family protein n=1 Tax=uncultured Flavobacterium sp. TaxID=165435 RepID=UPI0030CA4587
KFLKDRGFAPTEEPFKKLINQGMFLGMSAFVYRISGTNKYVSKNLKFDYEVDEIRVDVNIVNASDEIDLDKLRNWLPEFKDAEFITENDKYIVGREVEKMSKRWYNVVNPDDICEEYGADTLRLYEMFLGPLEQAKPWNTAGITGVFGFLKKLWRLYFDDTSLLVTNEEPTAQMYKSLHKTIKKVTEDIENFSFNTSVSQFMICVNELATLKCHHRAILEPLALLISPYAPHIAEELWNALGYKESISTVDFPIYDSNYLVESNKEYPVSFNGKMRFTLNLPLNLTPAQIEEIVMDDERTIAQLAGNTPKKVIIVPGKIINLVG